MPHFAEIQTAFAAAVLDPAAPSPGAVLGDDPSQREKRFAVYRNNVVSGLVGQLAQSFPVVQRLVGDEFFRAMARAFVLAHPPRSPVLLSYGDGFPPFIADFPPASGLPYLADVAALEALRIRAYHAADARAVTSTEITARLRAGRFATLKPHPAAHLLRSAFPVLAIWHANQPGSPSSRVTARKGENVLIVRPGMTVQCHPVADLLADAFDNIPKTAIKAPAEAARRNHPITELAALGAIASSQEEDES